MTFRWNVLTPKALPSKAQGQRRSRATLGYCLKLIHDAEGVRQTCVTPSA